MAKSRPSVQKRNHESRKLAKAREKAARKAARDEARANRPPAEEGVDPDLVGIVAGPQPVIEDPDEWDS
jgi:hypothetical protein